MLTVFLAYLDQLRAVTGMLAASFLFCRNAVPRREHFYRRAVFWSVLCLGLGFAYVPVEPLLASLPTVAYGAISSVYWVVVPLVMVVTVYRCYELPLNGALFRVLLGQACEAIVTTVVRYLVVMMWLPDLPEKHPVSYILLTLTIYVVMYWSAYRRSARPLQRGGSTVMDGLAPAKVYGFILLMFLLIIHSTNGICEWVVPTMADDLSLAWQCRLIRYFCIGIRFLVAIAFLTSQHLVYETGLLRRERDLVNQLLREKGEQYELTRENMEFIRRKCHDLKRQLRALEFAGEDERRSVLEETRRAAEFYDAVVQTGNEALDTLLTEKSMLCANRGIRLSCTVSIGDLSCMSAVDMYTMLSNALDNAIECVERFRDPEKKAISFSMAERGRMLCIAVENYYEGTVEMRDGYPITSKADKAEHGIGVRSIHTLAKRYGGGIRVNTEDQIFLLQIMVPLSQVQGAR